MARKGEVIANPDPTKNPELAREFQAAINQGLAIPVQGGSRIQFLENAQTPALDALRGGPVLEGGTGQITGDPTRFPRITPDDVNNEFSSLIGGLEGMVAGSSIPDDIGAFRTQVEEAERQRLARERALIQGRFEEATGEEREFLRAREGGVRGAGAVTGGTGTGLGLSTIQQSALAIAKRESDKRMRDLERSRDAALAQADMQSFERARAQIRDEENRLDTLRQREFDNRLKMIDTFSGLQQQKFSQRLAMERHGLDVAQFEAGQERFERTQGLVEAEFKRELKEAEKEQLLTNLVNMANSRISVDQIPEEERTAFEQTLGWIPATFEAIYDGMVNDVLRGDVVDELKIKQLQADIQNTMSQIAGRGAGGGTLTERLLSQQQQILNEGSKLDQERATSEDGAANPDTYRDLKRRYIGAGGIAENFFQAYPIEVYIHPDNQVGDLDPYEL